MAGTSVVYTFSAAGADTVERAFRSIAAEAHITSQKIKKSMGKAGAAAVAAAKAADRAWKAAGSKEVVAAKTAEQKKRAEITKTTIHIKINTRARISESAKEAAAAITAQQKVSLARRAMMAKVIGRPRSLPGGYGMMGMGLSAGLVGLGVAGAAVRSAVTLDQSMVDYVVKGRRPGQNVDKKDLYRSVMRAARSSPGAIPTEIMGAATKFLGFTGESKVAQSYMSNYARLQMGTGVKGAHLGTTSAVLFERLGIKSPEDQLEALSYIASSGKRNSFEFPDLAPQFGGVVAAYQKVSGGKQGMGAVRDIMGALQATKGQGLTAAGSAVGVKRFYTNLRSNVSKMQKSVGMTDAEVFPSDGMGGYDTSQMLDINDVYINFLKRAKGDIRLGKKALNIRGEVRGGMIGDYFNKQVKAGEGGFESQSNLDQAAKKTKKWIKSFEEGGANPIAEILLDAQIRSESIGAKLQAVWTEIGDQAMKILVPELKKLADNLPALIGGIKEMFILFKALGGVLSSLIRQFGTDEQREDLKQHARANRLAPKKARLTELQDMKERSLKKDFVFTGKEGEWDPVLHEGEMARLEREVAPLEAEIAKAAPALLRREKGEILFKGTPKGLQGNWDPTVQGFHLKPGEPISKEQAKALLGNATMGRGSFMNWNPGERAMTAIDDILSGVDPDEEADTFWGSWGSPREMIADSTGLSPEQVDTLVNSLSAGSGLGDKIGKPLVDAATKGSDMVLTAYGGLAAKINMFDPKNPPKGGAGNAHDGESDVP